MKWRVMVEVTGEDSAVTRHVISEDERTGVGQVARLGLNLAEAKATLTGLQRVLITTQSDTYRLLAVVAAIADRCTGGPRPRLL